MAYSRRKQSNHLQTLWWLLRQQMICQCKTKIFAIFSDEASKLMKDFKLTPRIFIVFGAVFGLVAGIGTAPFLYFVGVGLNYPLWLILGLSLLGLIFLYEGFSMLLKPLSFSLKDDVFRVGYILSNLTFKISDIDRYSAVSYFTKFGIRDGIIIHLKNDITLEISGVLIKGNICLIQEVFDEQEILRSPKERCSLWLTRFPSSY